MARNRGAHLVELAHVFAGTPTSSQWARQAAATRGARKAQLSLPGVASKPGGARIGQQRAELRGDLLILLRSLRAERREVGVDEIAALGLPVLQELEEILGILPGGANPAVLAKVALAKQKLCADHLGGSAPRRRGHDGK